MATDSSETPETRFIRLMSELFQLREAEELDFGIYRVIRRHNQQVRAFLGEVVEECGEPVLRGGELAVVYPIDIQTYLTQGPLGDRHTES